MELTRIKIQILVQDIFEREDIYLPVRDRHTALYMRGIEVDALRRDLSGLMSKSTGSVNKAYSALFWSCGSSKVSSLVIRALELYYISVGDIAYYEKVMESDEKLL